jgi:hypothetical protein
MTTPAQQWRHQHNDCNASTMAALSAQQWQCQHNKKHNNSTTCNTSAMLAQLTTLSQDCSNTNIPTLSLLQIQCRTTTNETTIP